jgi:hypothetical protein
MPERAPITLGRLTWRDVCEGFRWYRQSALLHELDQRFDDLASATPDHATVDEWLRLRTELDDLDGRTEEFLGKSGGGARSRSARAAASEGDHTCPIRICDRRAFGGVLGGAPLCDLTGKPMVAEHASHLGSSQSSTDAVR